MNILMNSELWNMLASISTVLGFIVVVVGGWVALGQLKEMTRVRHLEAMIQIDEMIASKESRAQRRYIYQRLDDDPKKLGLEDWALVEDVCGTFDRIGNLVEHNLIPKSELFDGHAVAIARLWIKLEPHIRHHRTLRGTEYLMHFETLARSAQAYYDKKYPGRTITISKNWMGRSTAKRRKNA